MTILHKFSIAFLSLLLVSCNPAQAPFDKEKATQEILELHHQQRDFHFQKMAKEFARLLSPDHISVNRGKVSSPTFEENSRRFQAYFDQVEFIRWDDTHPPVIRFSDDGSLVYTIVEKDLLLSYVDEEQQTIEEYTKFAWVAIYKKYKEGWKIDCVASTDQPTISYLSPRVMIQNIISKANCTSPQGKYTTEMHSTPAGFLFFKQSFDYKAEDFQAVVFEDRTAFSLNTTNELGDSLSQEVIEILRGHNFHDMAIHPEKYFSDMVFHKRDTIEKQAADVFNAKDYFKNPIVIYKDISTGKLLGLQLQNPANTEEGVEIYYRNWKETDYGPMVDQVDIIQNVKDSTAIRRDTFHFDFYEILINDRNFRKIEK